MFSFNEFCDVGAADTIKMSLEDAFDFVKSGKSLYELIPDPCRIYFDLDLYADEAKHKEIDRDIRTCIGMSVSTLFDTENYKLVTSHGKKKDKFTLSYHIYIPQVAESKNFIKTNILKRWDSEMGTNWAATSNLEMNLKAKMNLKADVSVYDKGRKFRVTGSRKAYKNKVSDREDGDVLNPRHCLIYEKGETIPIESTTFEDWADTIASNVAGLPKVSSKFNKTTEEITNDAMIELFDSFEKQQNKNKSNKKHDPVTIEMLAKVVENLNPERFGSHSEWVKLLLAIKETEIANGLNMKECIDIANELSSRAPGYKNRNDVASKYYNLDPKGEITFGSLCHWFKEQNPIKFDEYREENRKCALTQEQLKSVCDMYDDSALTTEAESDAESLDVESKKFKEKATILKKKAAEIRKVQKKVTDTRNKEEMADMRARIRTEKKKYEAKNCAKFEKDNYTFSDFQREMNAQKFKTEEEMLTTLVEKSRRVIVHIRADNFYMVKEDNKEKINLSCSNKHVENAYNFTIRYGNGIETTFYKLLEYVHDCSCLVCDPNSKEPGKFNIWNDGLAELVGTVDETKIKPLLDLIYEVWAGENQEVYDYLINWFGKMISKSKERTETVLFVKGREGSGKGTVTDFIERFILGPDLCAFVPTVKMFSEQQDVGVGKKLICINDTNAVTRTQQQNLFDTMKPWITDPTITVKTVYLKAYKVNPIANIICFANHDQGIIINNEDRRYMCIETTDKWTGQHEKFENLRATCFNAESANHFYTYCTTYKTVVNLRKIIMTDFKREVIKLNEPSALRFLREVKEEYDAKTTQKETKEENSEEFHQKEVSATEFYKDYAKWCQENGECAMKNVKFALTIKENIEKKRKTNGFYYNKDTIKNFK